jgi:hypothetical protein
MFDPDISGTGHQPMPFDTLMSLYEQYVVTDSAITVTGLPETNGVRLGIYLSPDTTAITDPIRLMENGLISTVSTDCASGSGGTGERKVSVTKKCDVAEYFHRRTRRDLTDDPDMSGTVAANPVEQVYFGVVVWCFYSSAAGAAFDYDVQLTYRALLTEPKKLAVS